MKPSVQHSSSKNNTILTKKITMLMTTITTIYKYKDVPLLKGLEKHIMTQLKVQYILKTPQRIFQSMYLRVKATMNYMFKMFVNKTLHNAPFFFDFL